MWKREEEEQRNGKHRPICYSFSLNMAFAPSILANWVIIQKTLQGGRICTKFA